MQFEQVLDGFEFLEAPRVADDGSLYFSEVMQGGVCRLSPDGRVERFVTDCTSIGGLALTEDGGFVFSGGEGLAYFNPVTGERRLLDLTYDGEPLGPFNDIQPDEQGSLYGGTTDFARLRAGGQPAICSLYRIDPPARVTRLREGVVISNGIGFSPDGRHLYHNETPDGPYVYDLLPDRTLANRRLVARFSGADGLAVDGEGGIWVAGYASGEIVRFLPDGAVDRRIDFSGRFGDCHVTSLAFGGPDLRDLYVVTAGDYRKRTANTGRVFKARSDVAGQRTPKVRF
jgi:sugar lactone lactonase YvrE